jgi:hypothetical protein
MSQPRRPHGHLIFWIMFLLGVTGLVGLVGLVVTLAIMR